jgi:hypothetical protein
MSRPNEYQKATFTITNAATATCGTLTPGGTYAIERVVFGRSGGTAASYILMLGDHAGFTDDANDGRLAKFDSALVSVDTDHQFDPPVNFIAVETTLAVAVTWNAGSDNDADGYVLLRRVG